MKVENIFASSPEELKKRFWDGRWNKAVRYYWYIQNGLALCNEARYLVMGILAIVAIFQIKQWWVIPVMFLSAIPPLLFLGWLSVHHMDKRIEYLRTQYSTHWSRYNIDLQEKQLDYVRKIHEFMLSQSIKMKGK